MRSGGWTMNKYRNIKTTTYDGITHDSLKEANRWCELKLLVLAGKIYDLKRQVKYVLIPEQYVYYERFGKNGRRLKDGKKVLEKECAYIADFVYTDTETNTVIVEDTKGVRTKEYVIKRKLMLWVHGIKIKEI
jgi:hypothetical protein